MIELMTKSGTYTEINSTLTIQKANRKMDTGILFNIYIKLIIYTNKLVIYVLDLNLVW